MSDSPGGKYQETRHYSALVTGHNMSLPVQARSEFDLEAGRACFALGDYADVLRITEDLLAGSIAGDQKLSALLLRACAQAESGKARDGLKTLREAGTLVDSAPARLRGRYFSQRANIHVKLADNDTAAVDYAEARFWAQQAGDHVTEATARNNLSKRYSEADRLDDAIVESDVAIAIFRQLRLETELGRAYDQRAQILVDHKRFAEALEFSQRAIVLLDSHPSGVEARETHGRALIGLGVSYLEQDDPVPSCKARRRAAALISTTVSKELMQLALDRSDGHVSTAAALLGMDHAALVRYAKRHSLNRARERHRATSLIKKK